MLIAVPASRTSFVAKIETDWTDDDQPGGSVEAALNQLAKRIKLMEVVINEILQQSEAILTELRITNKHFSEVTDEDFTKIDVEEMIK